MKSAALPLLRCSICRAHAPDLTLVDAAGDGDEIVSGALVCARGHRFPIERGIPDFVSDREAVGGDSPVYDTMWRMHEERSYPGRVAEYEAKFQRFATLPGRLSDYFEGKFVLDGGCGEGASPSLPARWARGTSSRWTTRDTRSSARASRRAIRATARSFAPAS